jgi:transposase-like protein
VRLELEALTSQPNFPSSRSLVASCLRIRRSLSQPSKIAPQVSDTWRADELYLKVRGNMKYLYALMDDETRFWIAKEVSETKYHADVHNLFKQGRKIAHKAPTTIITDGAPNFHAGIEAEFWREKKALALEHVQDIRMDGTVHNNKMERMNGEIRDREKVVRGVKKDDSPLIEGYQIFHNYIRPHMALDGKTPADLAGIKVQGENKWLTLIQNASMSNCFRSFFRSTIARHHHSEVLEFVNVFC